MMSRMDYIEQLKEKAKRNREIIRLAAKGWPNVKIAKHFGISRQRVHQVRSK